MSSALPLTEAASRPGGTPFAFASGLAVQGNTVVISHRDQVCFGHGC